MFQTKNMQYRQLGNTGLKVSVIGFGNAVNSNPERADIDDSLIIKCLENGVNFFDTAEVYSDGQCEKALGRALKKSGVNRSDIVVTTKIFRIGKNINTVNNLNRKHITQSIDASLKRLNLEYVDIVYAHSFHEQTPLEEICRGFNQIIEDGKAFYWGTSNWSANNIYDAFAVCDKLGLHRPVVEQSQYNMLVRKDIEVEFQTLFDKHHYGATIYAPLAGGVLTGKHIDGFSIGSRMDKATVQHADFFKLFYYEPHNNPKTISALKELQTLSKQLGGTLAQLALAWVIRNPNISTAILGATRPEQLDDSFGSLELLKKWTPELDQKINTILGTTPTPKFNWNQFGPGVPRRAELPK